MIVNTELASSKGCDQKDRWETPMKIFEPLNAEFKFTLEPCCETHTAKCCKYFTEAQNGLVQDWTGEVVFVSPPYSRYKIDKWMEKCYNEGFKGTTVVALIPVSTSAEWFHKYIWKKAEIRFIRRRVRFVGAPFTAPFSSMIAIWKQNSGS